MNTRQFTLLFRRKPTTLQRNANRNLIGRSYQQDKWITVTVIDVCRDDPGRVLVERDVDGKTWTMPGWLMRLIFLEELKRAA
jgi:hypothetical protein